MGLAVNATNDYQMPEGDRSEIDRLRTTHEMWRQYAPLWDMNLASYEGGPDFANERNIFRHFRENYEDYRDRAARLHYLNYCAPLVDFFTNFIFNEPIERSGGDQDAWFKDFSKNVDLRGHTIDDYMRQICDEKQIFGMVYTLVDTPSLPLGVTLSKQAEKEMGVQPYWVCIRPDEIIDWVVDDFDNFEYCKRRQITNEITDSGEIHIIEKYTEFYKDKVLIRGVDVTDPAKPKLTPQEKLVNPYGYIPLVVHRYKRSKRYPFMGNSFLRDFSYNNREILNLTSLLQEFLYRQCFNILAKEVDANIPLKDQEDGVVGTSNTIEVPKGAGMPQYITPPADPAQFIQSERNMIKVEMFARAAQETVNLLYNGEKSSGFSQAQQFSKTVPFIAFRADALEQEENKLMQLTMRAMNKKWNGRIKYKDRYEITNVNDAMVQLKVLLRDLLLPSETFVKTELKRMVHEFDGKLEAATLAKVEKEIDEMDFSQWQLVQEQALTGQSEHKSSPAAQQETKQSGTMAEVNKKGMQDQPAAANALKNGGD